jgi:hypothetical protein
MEDGEGVDGAARAFEDAVEAFGEVHLDEADGIAYVVAGEVEGGLDDLAGALGGDDGDRLGAAAEVHGGEEAGEAEEVVAVEVRDEDGAETLELEVVLAYAVLRAFGAVEQHLETVDVDYLGAAAAASGGQGGARTEDGDEEVHFIN